MHVRVLLLALSLGIPMGGCAMVREPTSPPSASLREPIHPPKPQDMGHHASRFRVYETYRMYTTDSLRHCAGLYPTFDFDSAKLDTDEHPGMRALAQCMKTGPLQDKQVLLTGKTDPRGTDAYNDKLGLERAERVKRYLLAQGIPSARVLTRSVGESDASPLPRDWPQDRHVQVTSAP